MGESLNSQQYPLERRCRCTLPHAGIVANRIISLKFALRATILCTKKKKRNQLELQWSEWKLSPTGSCAWTLSPQLVAPFGDVMGLLRDVALMEEVCHWEWGYSIPHFLFMLSTSCVWIKMWSVSFLLLTSYHVFQAIMDSFWNTSPSCFWSESFTTHSKRKVTNTVTMWDGEYSKHFYWGDRSLWYCSS